MYINGVIDLSNSTLESTGNLVALVVHKGTAFPTNPSPTAGQLFYRTDTNKFYIYNSITWSEVGSGGGGGGSFITLSDTPASYSGSAGKVVSVKATEDGLEFTTGGGSTSGLATTNDVLMMMGA